MRNTGVNTTYETTITVVWSSSENGHSDYEGAFYIFACDFFIYLVLKLAIF